jgi:hypothetical protein
MANAPNKLPNSLKNLPRLIVPFFLAACLICGYWFYWSKAAATIETNVRNTLGPGAASSVKVTGFPYRLTLEVRDLNLKAQNGAAFTASSVNATATPFNPMLWVLEGALEPTLALPGGPSRPLKANNLKASMRLQEAGVERFSLTFDGLEALGNGGWSAGKGLFHLMTTFQSDNTLAMVIDLTNLRIAKPLDGPGAILGGTIGHIFVSGPIELRSALMTSLQTWRDAGGKFKIMAGEIVWGPVYLTKATGELSLSQANSWQGKVAGQGALKPEGIAVSGLSGPINLEIRDGQLFLSGLPGIPLFSGTP